MSAQRPGEAINPAARVPRDRLAAVPEGATGLLPEVRGRGSGGATRSEVKTNRQGNNTASAGRSAAAPFPNKTLGITTQISGSLTPRGPPPPCIVQINQIIAASCLPARRTGAFIKLRRQQPAWPGPVWPHCRCKQLGPIEPPFSVLVSWKISMG